MPRRVWAPKVPGTLTEQRRHSRYRTKLELLRDFLLAVSAESGKTRIINRANLNPASFRRYLLYCNRMDLVRKESGGYYLTDKAVPAVNALDHFIERSGELDTAFRDLQRVFGRGSNGAAAMGPAAVRHHASRAAWAEMVAGRWESLDLDLARSAARSGAVVPSVLPPSSWTGLDGASPDPRAEEPARVPILRRPSRSAGLENDP